MLRQITWPPEPGPTTGFKTKFPEGLEHEKTESLNQLIHPGWWSGVKIIVPTEERASFSVRLVTEDGEPVFMEERDQEANVWVPFPWLIPGGMATAMKLRLEVKRIDSDSPFMFGIITSFCILPTLLARDRYLFMKEDRHMAYFWNGAKNTWGSPTKGDEPAWRTIHTVIPPFDRMGSWNQPVFCIHDWSERLMPDSLSIASAERLMPDSLSIASAERLEERQERPERPSLSPKRPTGDA
jgi:hypothetical protein